MPESSRGDYEAYFEMTSEGEPMNLNESAAWIVDNREPLEESNEDLPTEFQSSTHVVLLTDNVACRKGKQLIYGSHVTKTAAEFEQLELLKGKDRASRANVTFGLGFDFKTARAIIQEQKQSSKHVFQFPSIIKQAKLGIPVTAKWPLTI